jgi:hypothetical protein
VVATASLNLGEVWEDANFMCHLPVENRSGDDITVLEFAVACNCISVEPKTLTIPVGKTQQIRLTLDLAHRNPQELGLQERPFELEITPRLKGGYSRKGWKLKGIVKSRVTADTLALNFGEACVQGEPSSSRKVVATLHVPAQGIEARVDPKVATSLVTRRKDDPTQFEIWITPTTGLLAGPFRSDLRIHTQIADGQALPGVTIPILGRVQPPAQILPARIFFPALPVGQTAEQVVVLQAPTTVPVQVTSIESESVDVKVNPTTVDGVPSGRAFRISQRIAHSGDQSSAVRFHIRKSEAGPPNVVAVEVRYYGMSSVAPSPTKEGEKWP